MCRSRRELSNAYLLAKFRLDTAENEPCKVCRIPRYRARALLHERTIDMSGNRKAAKRQDRKGILECVQRRLAWARLAAHDDRLLRDELGNAEPKQFELDEVEANLAVLRALSSDESDDKTDSSLCLHVKKTYVEMLPSEHPARAQYQ